MGAGLPGELTRAEAERACARDTDRQGRGEANREQERNGGTQREKHGDTHTRGELRTRRHAQRRRDRVRRGGEVGRQNLKRRDVDSPQRDKFRARSGREGESQKQREGAKTGRNKHPQTEIRRSKTVREDPPNPGRSCSRTAQILRPGPPSSPPLTRIGGVGSHTPGEVGKGPHFPNTGPLRPLTLTQILALLVASSGLGTIAENVLHTYINSRRYYAHFTHRETQARRGQVILLLVNGISLIPGP